MPRVVITAEVEDLTKWELGFRTHRELFRQMGVLHLEYGTSEGNRVAVAADPSDLDAYMNVIHSPATAKAMAFDGVKRETVRVLVLDKVLTV